MPLPNARAAPALAAAAPPAAWTPILGAYCVYLGLALAGFLLGRNLLVAGGVLFVAVIGVIYSHTLLQARATGLTLAVLFAILLPFIALAGNDDPLDAVSLGTLFKHSALYLMLLMLLHLRLVPLPRCSPRIWGWLYGAVVAVLSSSLLSASLPGAGMVDGRASGLFENPNNLALMAICLCCLIDEASPWWVRWLTHGLVILFLLVSGTSGAIVGYLVGRGYRLCHTRRTAQLILLGGMVITGGVLLAPEAIAQALQSFPPTRAVMHKIIIAQENVPLILEGRGINYWRLVQRTGDDMTSGLWRLAHWRKTLHVYCAGTPLQQLFGFGLGTSERWLDKKPHNDCLRVLFEMGLAGCLVLALIWGALFVRMAPAARWVFVMVATYSLTENNADNFIAISLLTLFIVSAGTRGPWQSGAASAGGHTRGMHGYRVGQ
jgi:hypothetical protein